MKKKIKIFQEQYDSDGRSCFMWSVIADQELLVQHFLEYYQPNRNHKDKYGYTALHHAAHVGSLHLVKLLVKEGWNIHVSYYFYTTKFSEKKEKGNY